MTFNRANPDFMINFPEELLIKIMESIEKDKIARQKLEDEKQKAATT